MVSIGPNSQSNNFSHMFDNNPIPNTIPKNTILAQIYNHPDFTYFKKLTKKSGLENILADLQADITLFIPDDNLLSLEDKKYILNADRITAMNIIKNCMLNKRITSDILKENKASYFITRNPKNKLLVSYFNQDLLINDQIKIIFSDIECINGLIHITDNLIKPLIY